MKIRLISVFAAIAAVIIFALPDAVDAKKDIFELDEVYPLDKDGTIYLNTNDAEVKIIGSNRDDVHVEIYYEAEKSGLFWKVKGGPFEVEVTTENGNLHIREYDRDEVEVGVVMHTNYQEYTITIAAPQSASLRIRGDDDDYEIRNVAGRISLSFEDGDASLEECNGEEFDFEVEDGNIEMVGGKGNLSAYVEDGCIFIADGQFSEIMAEVEDGDIEIATTLSNEGTYRMESEDGDVEFHVLGGGGEFKINYEDGRVKASSAFEMEDEDEYFRIYTLPGGNAKIRIRTEDGRVRLYHK